jgi:hypothetical protein
MFACASPTAAATGTFGPETFGVYGCPKTLKAKKTRRTKKK